MPENLTSAPTVVGAFTLAFVSLVGLAVWLIKRLVDQTIPGLEKSFSAQIAAERAAFEAQIAAERAFFEVRLRELSAESLSRFNQAIHELREVRLRLDRSLSLLADRSPRPEDRSPRPEDRETGRQGDKE